LGDIDVVAVDGKSALKAFIEFPYSLYRNDPHWVPPLRIAVKELLDRKKHPFCQREAEFSCPPKWPRGGRIAGSSTAITIISRRAPDFRLLRVGG
jgi:hypothetical protein